MHFYVGALDVPHPVFVLVRENLDFFVFSTDFSGSRQSFQVLPKVPETFGENLKTFAENLKISKRTQKIVGSRRTKKVKTTARNIVLPFLSVSHVIGKRTRISMINAPKSFKNSDFCRVDPLISDYISRQNAHP